jgi:hypothetical protein
MLEFLLLRFEARRKSSPVVKGDLLFEGMVSHKPTSHA